MNQPWMNYDANICYQNYSGSISSPFSESYQTINPVEYKSKAYVNPNIVKLPYPLTNSGSYGALQKIHINPKFQRTNLNFIQSTNNSACLRKEPNFIHINPNFDKFKICDQVKPSAVFDSDARTSEWGAEFDQNHGSSHNPFINQCLTLPEVYNPPCLNSAYSWVSDNSSFSQSAELQDQNMVANSVKPAKPTLFSISNSPKIKTRHKIVRKVNVNSLSSKFKGNNQFKIVNIGKEYPKSKISKFSKINVLNISNKKYLNHNRNFQDSRLKNLGCATNSKHKLVNFIKTNYKINRLSQKKKDNLICSESGNLKVDREKKLVYSVGSQNVTTYNARKLTPKTAGINRVWKLGSSTNVSKSCGSSSWKTVMPVKDLNGKSFPNRTLVNIGGIMYKSTVNKLTRTKDKRCGSPSQKLKVKSEALGKRVQVVYVRGEKFLLGDEGKTLIRQNNAKDNSKATVKRVDIGGVTYIEKTNNVLIQTNSHQARTVVLNAKQRSIAVLKSLRKRSNMPCMIYHRFGVCTRHKNGICIYVHDPKNIALCKKYLKGECNDSKCLLSHNAVEEKMATCRFFLQGNCYKENCQYLHVNVNKKAVICKDFLQGFCSLGQNCKKRHVHQCPNYDKTGTCSQGAKCPYPHKISKDKEKSTKCYKISKFKLTKKVKPVKQTDSDVSKVKKLKIKKRRSKKVKDEQDTNQKEVDDSVIECIPKRIKIDDLPLYIPLNNE